MAGEGESEPAKGSAGGAAPTAMLSEQHRSLSRLVPVLYVVVIISTAALSFAFTGIGPPWLINWIPLAMLVVVSLRLRYWLKARETAGRQSEVVMLKDVRSVIVLGPLLTLGFTLVGIGLMPYADIYLQSLAVVAIWVTAVASAFCLASVPRASVLVVLAAGAPLTVSFLLKGNIMMAVLGGVFGVVTLLIVYMLRETYGAFAEMVMSRLKIDEKHRQAEQARQVATRMAHTDHLTGLSNRRHFELVLAQRVAAPALQEKPFAVGIIDLDGFKPINDVHGHGVGDAMLSAVAARLTEVMQGRGALARMGGDEFAVLVEDVADEAQALAFAVELRQRFAEPFSVSGVTASLGCSLGLSLYPQSGVDPDRLIDRADMALYRAKAAERGASAVFSHEHERAALARARIEQGLRVAVAERTLSVWFQPIFALESGALTGFEALARWHDRELGPVSPAVFIPIAEQIGLIEALTDDLLLKAATIAAGWPDHLTLSFNFSAEQLVKPSAGLRVAQILEAAGLPPRRFEAEVTETALMKDIAAARTTIVNLKAIGARVSLDDFGTGYSSLSQIKDLPLDKVKIDKSFVDHICTDQRMNNLVRSIVTMCENLDLSCVAEGIELPEQLEALKNGGCFGGQGYLFSRPVPAIEVDGVIFPSKAA